METPILSPTLPVESIERNQPSGNTQSPENFAEVLAKQGFQAKENEDSTQAVEKKSTSSPTGSILAALMIPLPVAPLPEKNLASPEPSEGQLQKPSSGLLLAEQPLMPAYPFDSLPFNFGGDKKFQKGSDFTAEVFPVDSSTSGAAFANPLPANLDNIWDGRLPGPSIMQQRKENGQDANEFLKPSAPAEIPEENLSTLEPDRKPASLVNPSPQKEGAGFSLTGKYAASPGEIDSAEWSGNQPGTSSAPGSGWKISLGNSPFPDQNQELNGLPLQGKFSGGKNETLADPLSQEIPGEKAGLHDSVLEESLRDVNKIFNPSMPGGVQKGNGAFKKGGLADQSSGLNNNPSTSDPASKTSLGSLFFMEEKRANPPTVNAGNQGAEGAALKKGRPADIGETGNRNQFGQDVPFKDHIAERSPYERGAVNPSLDGELKGTEKYYFKQNDQPPLSNNSNHSGKGPYELFVDPGGNQRFTLEMSKGVKTGFTTALGKNENIDIPQQIGQKVLWSIRNNEEKIRLSLDPPELGNIYMEITRERDHIKTTLWTDNQMTKVTLESSQTQIQKIMENEGFKLEKFNVFIQQDMGSFQGRRENPIDQNPWKPSFLREQKDDNPGGMKDPLPVLEMRASRGSNYVDVFI